MNSSCVSGRKWSICVCLFCPCKKPCGGSSELLYKIFPSWTVCYNLFLEGGSLIFPFYIAKDPGSIIFPGLLPADIRYEPLSVSQFKVSIDLEWLLTRLKDTIQKCHGKKTQTFTICLLLFHERKERINYSL